MTHRSIALSFLGLFLAFGTASAATYDVDVQHSTVGFKIKHLLSNTQGQFTRFSGVVNYEPGQPASWSAEGTIETASIDTNVEKRDEHLRSADFFEADKYPTISFKTVKVLESTDTTAKIEGILTMHGVEKPVVLDVTIHGIAADPWGNTRIGFTAETRINRKDFGLGWNKALETGGVLVGEEVVITLEIEGIQKA